MNFKKNDIAHPELSTLNWNLNFIIKFHNDVSFLINSSLKIDNSKMTYDEIKSYEHAREIYNYYHTKNVFLMMYSFVEELLNMFVKGKTQTDKTGLDRFNEALGEKIIKSNEWNTLILSQKLRNCLLHANGRLFGKDTKKFKKFHQKKYIEIEKDTILIKKEFLVFFAEEINKLFNVISEHSK